MLIPAMETDLTLVKFLSECRQEDELAFPSDLPRGRRAPCPETCNQLHTAQADDSGRALTSVTPKWATGVIPSPEQASSSSPSDPA